MAEASTPWSEALEGLVRSVRTTIDLQQRLMRSAGKPSEAGAAYVRFLRSELLPYGRTITDLTVDYYKALAAAAREYGTAFYDEVLAGVDTAPSSTAEPAAGDEEHAVMTLAGDAGTQAAATFTLENHDPETAEVTLEAGVCRGPEGEAFAAPLRIEPSSLSIPSGETAKVTVAVDLSSDHFTPNVGYRLPLHVNGPRPATVDVTIVATDVREAGEVAGTAEPGADAEEPGAGAAVPEESAAAYIVECPTCRRRFDRTTDSLRLRPHKTPEGEDCPERDGRRPRRPRR